MGLFGTGASYASGGAWTAPFAGSAAALKPFTILTWIRETSANGGSGGTFGGFGSSAGSGYATLYRFSTFIYAAESNDANAGASVSSTVTSTTVWNPMIGVFSGPASRLAYSSSGSTATDTTSLAAPESFNTIGLGDYVSTTASSNPATTTMLMAEFAIWACALGVSEIASLQAGASPLRVRPEALFCYFPLRGDLLDRGPLRLALKGRAPVWGEHPPVAPIRPLSGRYLLRSSAAAASLLSPQLVWMD